MADRATRVLFVDDERPITTLISFPLQRRRLRMISKQQTAPNAPARCSTAVVRPPYVLDVMLPRVDGLETCSTASCKGRSRSALMLPAESHEIDKVLRLKVGANDYMAKLGSCATSTHE